jgi:hypothetical protein
VLDELNHPGSTAEGAIRRGQFPTSKTNRTNVTAGRP